MLAYGAIGGNAVPLWIANEQGIFRKYNLDPQLVYIIAGRAMQSMLAGEIQFGLLGATHVTNAVTAGGDMTMLLGMEEKLNYFLNARPGIKNAEDLKGKKVGIGTPSGSLPLATYVGLDHLGLVPRRDGITLLNTGSTPERMSALFAGGIDAAFFNPEVDRSSCNRATLCCSISAKRMFRFNRRVLRRRANTYGPIPKSSKTWLRRSSKASLSCETRQIKRQSSIASGAICGLTAPIV
jgi:hypothetical protein